MKKLALFLMVICISSLYSAKTFATVPAHPSTSGLESLPYGYSGNTYADRVIFYNANSKWAVGDFKQGTNFNPTTFNTGGYWDIGSSKFVLAASANFRLRCYNATNGTWGSCVGSYNNYINGTENLEDSIIYATMTLKFVPYNTSFCYNVYPGPTRYCGGNVINIPVDLMGANTLTIVRNPSTGGGVSDYPLGENIYCGIDGYDICQASFTPDTEVTLDAYPNNGWAFGNWDDGATCLYDNPLTLTMDWTKTLTAKFFRTFRYTVGDFYLNINDTGGECVDYVKYETGITDVSGNPFSGDAWEYYQEAIDAGYATGDTPLLGSIAVFDRSTLPDYGHVGIVTSSYIDSQTQHLHLVLRHSNWCSPATCHTVSENDVDVDGKVIHYIYHTP